MILLHRLTPTLIGLLMLVGFGVLPLVPRTLLPVSLVIGVTLILVTLLFARLGEWKWRTFTFWYLLGAPVCFLASGFGMSLFLESFWPRFFVAACVVGLSWLFGENVFTFLHLPAKYRAYAIEYLSLIMNVLTVFLFAATGFGLILFIQTSVFFLMGICFGLAAFVICGTLWVSKIDHRLALLYGLTGAVLLTELFMALSYLPTGFYANAAWLTLMMYVYVGLMRAHLLEKMSFMVVRRYVLISGILAAFIAATTSWL